MFQGLKDSDLSCHCLSEDVKSSWQHDDLILLIDCGQNWKTDVDSPAHCCLTFEKMTLQTRKYIFAIDHIFRYCTFSVNSQIKMLTSQWYICMYFENVTCALCDSSGLHALLCQNVIKTKWHILCLIHKWLIFIAWPFSLGGKVDTLHRD